jgi:hypothetical protein
VYLVAILLLGWGTLVLSVWVSLKDPNYSDWARVMIPVALELGTGVGLLFGRRWAWVLGILTSVVLIEEGLRRVVFGPDRELIVLFSWTIHYFIPAIVILVCLLPGRRGVPSLGRGSRMPTEPTDEAGDLRSLLE